jgi:2'-5' RNA ligase
VTVTEAAARRLFIAVPLAADASSAVRRLVEGIRAEPPAVGREVRWVRLDGLHLTLRFLGPTPDADQPAVEAAVAAVAGGQAPFRIAIDGAGAFPSGASPRVLWLGVTDGTAELSAMARALDDRLVGAGWASDDRVFTPHLTIARSDGVRDGPRIARLLIERAAALDAGWRADRLILYESITGRGERARYVPLLEASFRG